jgi:signal transduction histidine kinase/CheY-like chemotaxis protein/HPt (histidine-containing phosphotransfer) domain-containing protein
VNAKVSRYEALLAMMGEGVLLHAADGTILGCNAAAERVLATSAKELIGRPVSGQMLTPEGAPMPHDQRPSVRAARTGEPVRAQIGMLVADRPLQWLSVRASLLPDGIVATTFVDITPQRMAEARGRRWADMLERLVASYTDGIVVIDCAGRIAMVNETYRTLFGLAEPEALIGADYDEVAASTAGRFADPEGWRRQVAADRAANVMVAGRTVELADGGRMIWEFLPLGDRDDLQMWTYYDITEMKRLEERLRSARDAALAAARGTEEFLAMMSHEVRTPLAGIASAAELLGDGGLTDDQRALVSVIADAAGVAGGLLGDVLDVARMEAGSAPADVVDFEPRALLDAIGGVLRPTLHGRPVALEIAADATLPPVLRGDCARIRQIVLNLAGNAVKYTDRGRVRLSAAYAGGRLRVTVADTGRGIAAGELERLFEPWTRGHGREVPGSGLGLSIARRLARVLGGDVSATSAPGAGSEFTLELPCAPGGPAATDEPRALPAVAPPAPLLAGRVLLAEDDGTLRRVLAQRLERLGLTITVVGDGGAALAAAATGAHDLLLIDLRMPVLDGRAVAARVRADEGRHGRARLPIVALSADARPEDVAACRAAGMDGHLAKPAGARELHAALAAWLPEPPVVDAAVLDELAAGLGDTAPLINVLRTYRAELPARLDALAAVVAGSDAEAVRRAAHALRSPSASFGLARLAAHLRRLEDGKVDGPAGLAAVRVAGGEADAALHAWCTARAA